MKKRKHRPIAKEGVTAAANILRNSMRYSKADYGDDRSIEVITELENALTEYLRFMGYTPMDEAFAGYGRNEK
jgi:hypothetical protein